MKKIRINVLLFLTLFSTLFSNVTFANHRGPYLEGNIGTLYSSIYIFNNRYSALGFLGLNANVGYQFNNYFALESGYTAYMAFLNDYGYLNNIDIAAKVIYPYKVYDENFNVFAKLGAGYVFKFGKGLLLPMVGVGAAYEITPRTEINFQMQGITIWYASLGLISFGITHHFDW